MSISFMPEPRSLFVRARILVQYICTFNVSLKAFANKPTYNLMLLDLSNNVLSCALQPYITFGIISPREK